MYIYIYTYIYIYNICIYIYIYIYIVMMKTTVYNSVPLTYRVALEILMRVELSVLSKEEFMS